MKTFLTTLLILTATVLPASINPSDLKITTDSRGHLLTIQSDVSLSLPSELRVLDDNGVLLHNSKLVAGAKLNTRLQLRALPSGDYRIEFTDAEGTTVQPLKIDRQGIEADVALATRSYFPRVDLNDKLLTINYLNVAGDRVDVRLSDNYGNEVIEDRLPASTTVQRSYSLENLPEGEYYVTVSSPGARSHITKLLLD